MTLAEQMSIVSKMDDGALVGFFRRGVDRDGMQACAEEMADRLVWNQRKLQDALKWVGHRQTCQTEDDAEAKCDCGFEEFWERIHK